MKVIEFETIIRRGLIHIPSSYKNMRNIQAKVIIMVDESGGTENYDRVLLLKMFDMANKTGLFNEINDSVNWQKQQRNDWE